MFLLSKMKTAESAVLGTPVRLADTTVFLASLWAARGWFDPRPVAPEDVSDTRAIRALNFEEMQIETSVRSGAETQ